MKKLLCILLIALGTASMQAQTYSVLHNFGGVGGSQPQRNLTLLGSHLYGMTTNGGDSNYGCIFTIDTNGNGFRVIHNFSPLGGNGPGWPAGSLTLSGSTLYGTTTVGGTSGNGAIFSIDTNGSSFTVLHEFNGFFDGADPRESLTLLGNTLFGVTELGGKDGSGIIFSISTNGLGYKILLNFNDTDGGAPIGDLVAQGKHLYGVASAGGTGFPFNSAGCIYRIDTNGANDTVLYSLTAMDGSIPWGTPILSGNTLYGTTEEGGTGSFGTVFSVNTNGTGFTVLANGDAIHGGQFVGDLLLSGNNLLGLAPTGGNGSTIYSVTTNGSSFNTVVDFTGTVGAYMGKSPYGGLISSGNTFYGMTQNGGTQDSGVLFKLSGATLGINDIQTNNSAQVNVYPNPNNGNFTVNFHSLQSGKYAIEVYNIIGEQVLKTSLDNTQNNSINMGAQPSGVYLYRVIAENGNLIGQGKLVIQK
jgi:uncharacterized repeat protein (TIGR03803 family)